MSKKDPWTDPDPQPGDFDEYLATVDPRDVEVVEACSGAKAIFIGDEDPDDWVRRQRAKARRQPKGDSPASRARR